MPIAPRRLLWLFLALCIAGSAGAQTSFTSVVVFGDSLSDTGNIARLVQNANPLGIRFPADNPALGLNYTDGRFTDGADTQPPAQAYFGVWIEQLAASFPAKPPVKDSLDGGTNYAYGDATTGPGMTTESDDGITISLHNMGQQVTDYQANVASKSAAGPTAQTLFVLWGGANDLYNAASAGTDLTAATTAAVSNELALVQQLAGAGATNFLIPNLPPLGGVPNYATSANAMALNAASAGFAQALTQGIATLKASLAAAGVTITVYQPDIFDLFGKFATGPMAVGLSDIADKAQGISGNPDTYLIWDGLHPTTTGHHFAAATAANLFTPLVNSTTTLSVPAASQPGATVTLTAGVKSGTAGNIPAGLVTFFNGMSLLGSAALNASGTGTATFVAAAAGSPYSLTAVYAGDEVNNISASAVQPLTVVTTPVVPPGFTAAVNPSSLTITAGNSAMTTLSTSDVGGFSSTITPTCGTLPAHLSCTIAALVAPGPVGQSAWSLTVATNAATAALDQRERPGVWRTSGVVSATLLFAATFLLGFQRRVRAVRGLWLTALVVMISAGAMIGLSGCGSSSNNDAASGTYTIPVVFTPAAGTTVVAQTVNLMVTVQ